MAGEKHGGNKRRYSWMMIATYTKRLEPLATIALPPYVKGPFTRWAGATSDAGGDTLDGAGLCLGRLGPLDPCLLAVSSCMHKVFAIEINIYVIVRNMESTKPRAKSSEVPPESVWGTSKSVSGDWRADDEKMTAAASKAGAELQQQQQPDRLLFLLLWMRGSRTSV